MKKTILTILALLSFVVCNAQLKTHSNYDVNGDGSVNITDVTAVVNKVLGKATDEQTVAESKSIAAWILKLENLLEIKVDDHSSLDKRMLTIEQKVQSIKDPYTGHEYVDLGLPSGLKWATCNIGASSPEDYGYYFAWGATEPQEVYDWVHTPYQTQNTTKTKSTIYSKYLGSTSSSFKDSSATDADALKTVLDPEDDAAHVNWGGEWHMPTSEDIEELQRNCYRLWVTSYNGKPVSGYIFYKAKYSEDKALNSSLYSPVGSYSLSDPHIFLPAAGYRYSTDLFKAGSYGCYWSASLSLGLPYFVYGISINSSDIITGILYRAYGQCVRPVCP